jgi:D-amino-acid dehydrogenase
MRDGEVAIIGAGIVGICVATYLAEAGRDIIIYDRTGICEGTSSGNAAAFAFSDVLPLVQKGMMRQLPRWLSDPLGPLSVPPAYLPQLAPWLWRFWRASSQAHYETSLSAQAALMAVAEREWMALLDRSGTRAMLNEHGALELYESEKEFRASLPGWDARARHGYAFRHMDQDGAAAIQPGLSDRFVRATFVPGWKNVSDPKILGTALYGHAEGTGRIRYERREVTTIAEAEGKVLLKFTDGGDAFREEVVICAGAWSHQLAAQLGDRIPLETERGYNTTLPGDAFDVRCQLIFPGHGFVVTPLSTGLRVGGAVELGGLERAPNYARSRAMLEKAKRFLPGLKTQGGREWMGYRPSLPDSLPVIGKARSAANVYYAFGNGHLGLTQGAAMGSLVRDLVQGRASPIDLTPYSPQRF